MLSTREIRRYQPQINLSKIGIEGQEKFKLSKILVIGAGAIGTATLKNLVTAGIGSIGICDDALIREEDFCWQNVFGDGDIGKQKAIVSKQNLQKCNSYIDIKVHNIRLTIENLAIIIENYDIIIDTTSNIETHLLLAFKTNKPCIFGSIINNKGFVFSINNITEPITKSMIEKLYTGDIEHSDTSTPLVIVYTLVGGIIASEAIKVILAIQSPISQNKVIALNISDYSMSLLNLSS